MNKTSLLPFHEVSLKVLFTISDSARDLSEQADFKTIVFEWPLVSGPSFNQSINQSNNYHHCVGLRPPSVSEPEVHVKNS